MVFAPVGEWVPTGAAHADVDPRIEEAWRTTWMTAVRDCEHPGLLVDLPSKQILQVSVATAEAFGLDLLETETVEALVAAADATPVLDLLAEGAMETVHGRRGYRTPDAGPDAAPLDVWCWARAVHSPSGGVMALMGLEVASSEANATPLLSVPYAGVADVHRRAADLVSTIELDQQWRVDRSKAGPRYDADLATGPRQNAYVLDAIAMECRPSMLCALALATSGATVGIWLRLESSGARAGRIVSAVVRMRPDDHSRFVMELYALDEPAPDRAAARAAELERRMRRIAAEVQAADVLDTPDRDLSLRDVPRLAELSERQVEILARLMGGQRVPAIARHMYLAPSTVRNHLSTVFRKLGVHSQADLIDLVRSSTNDR
jgi:DNA-binding CsgD family transcriptional regulator